MSEIDPKWPTETRIDYADGNLDDVVIPDVKLFRLEYMDHNSVWIRCYMENGRDHVIWLNARGKIKGAHHED